MTQMPAWLLGHLIDTGVIGRDGATRKAQHRRCPTCHAHIVIGLDANVAALSVAADATPIDPIGEVLALLAGRRTYDLTGTRAGRPELNHRDQYSIAAPRRDPVVAQHRCGAPALPADRAAIASLTTYARSTDGPPPY